jgi:hypothetical protein
MAYRAGFVTLSAAILLGCAQSQPRTPPPAPAITIAPASKPAPSDQADWNIFPDPITGRVEIYRDGAYVGSVTGDDSEEPPLPRKRPPAATDSN